LRANGAFRQSSSSIFGNADASRLAGNIGTAMLFEPYLPEQIGRVQQPPKMRETFAGPTGAKAT